MYSKKTNYMMVGIYSMLYGVVHREVYPVVPQKVEYSLTEMVKSFLLILYSLNECAKKYTTQETAVYFFAPICFHR